MCRVHVCITKLKDMAFNKYAQRAFQANQMVYLAELVCYRKDDLVKKKHFSISALNNIDSVLKYFVPLGYTVSIQTWFQIAQYLGKPSVHEVIYFTKLGNSSIWLKPLSSFKNFNRRAQNAFTKSHIKLLGQLVKLQRNYLMREGGFGFKIYQHVETELGNMGYSFDMVLDPQIADILEEIEVWLIGDCWS